ncbi:MAG TPA: PAS domain S-box protein [Nitrospira sp.]|nr:PAS domain S-box protein [Nitrospira sp.]
MTNEWWRIGAILLLISILFVLDIYAPLGFANHFLYALVVVLAIGSKIRWLMSATAALSTALTVLAILLSLNSPDLPLWIPIGNCLFTIIIIWVVVWFAQKRRQAEAALQKANERLEEKVIERTRQLAGVNEALVSEVTERMQTEHAFRLSEGRLAGILDIAQDAIILIEEDRSISLFNQGASRLFGYSPEEVLGRPVELLLPARYRLHHPSNIQAFAFGPESARPMAERREVFGLRKDGKEFPAEASISKLTIGEKTTFTVILRDITDRQQTEQQLQSLTAQLMTAQEEERRRISRELHDDINQRLAILAIEMGNMETGPSLPAEQSRQAIQSLAQRLATISDDVRRIAYEFHSSILDDLGLPAALTQLTDEFSSRTGVKTIVVQEELTQPFPRDIASCLYRITQESLVNVSRHAKASRVELELTCDGAAVTLSIHDNGKGFDPHQHRHQRGLGLINMRERVRAIQGRMEIHSRAGHGTRISVLAPLPGVTADEETPNPAG